MSSNSVSEDPTGPGIPVDPRLDWRTRLPVPGVQPPVAPLSAQRHARRPIDAPPVPRRLLAPHNLFTIEEITAALGLLADGLEDPESAQVLVTHAQGGSHFLAVADLVDINYLTEVVSIGLSWYYPDGSHLRGKMVDRPRAAALAVEGGGQALASTQHALEHLKRLRPGQASVRGWLAGPGLEGLYVGIGGAVFVVYLLTIDGAAAGLRPPSTPAGLVGLAVVLVLGLTLSRILGWLFARVRRRVGGTRLAPESQAHRKLLTQELGVLATAVGTAIALLALIVAIIGL